jgi:hypothetical protein
MLVRVAYRMLGSLADAEDVVREAYLRWMRADGSDVSSPELQSTALEIEGGMITAVYVLRNPDKLRHLH